eukprot:479699-Prymnesium_polylepis.1
MTPPCTRAIGVPNLTGRGISSSYLQRADHRLKKTGKATMTADARQRKEGERLAVKGAMEVPWLWTLEAALAVWS